MANVRQGDQNKGSILIVDDDLASLRAIYAILADQGYKVRGAPDGLTALMVIDTELPELILLDVVMPEMDGFEVCRRLKSESRTRNIPIMFLSASEEIEDKVKGFELGGVDYIPKPFQAEEVLARVRTHIDLHRLYEQAKILAVDTERQRLARELHDSVTQSLFLAASMAETLPRIWEQNPEKARQALDGLRKLTHGALAEMRSMLLEMRPDSLIDQRIGALLCQLAEGLMARTRMDVDTTTIEDNCPLPDDVQIALYRIAQEALNNIVKHSRADQIMVRLICKPEQITLSIQDDGIGFDLQAIEQGSPVPGLGLGIMRERAKTIGAEFVLHSEPGQGTKITVNWDNGSKGNGTL